MTSTVSEARIKRAFATFDYNNKGHITHDELERILRALGFRGMSKQLVATFMRTTSTRKNPSEVTYGDCLRIIQSSGFDHIFEESFQVCQVLDKKESGRIVPEAMMKAAKGDGRFDAYVPQQQPDGTFGQPVATLASTYGNTFRRGSFGGEVDALLPVSKQSADAIDDDELTKGGDRSTSDGHPTLGFDPKAIMSLTTSKKPLAPASAKRAATFTQVHNFIARADDHIPSPPASSAPSGAKGHAAAAALHQQREEEQDTALTFDEWRQVQASAEKAVEAALRRKRRHQAPPQSLAATLRASSSGLGLQLTPRREYSSSRQ